MCEHMYVCGYVEVSLLNGCIAGIKLPQINQHDSLEENNTVVFTKYEK